MGSDQRKQFESVAGQEVPTYQVTCTEAILPGGSGKARGRQIEYGEFDAVFDVYDLHYQNCILPHERFEVSFDQERGEYYPLGSRGLFRQVKATADGSICTNVPCLIQTESQAVSQVEGEETCRVKLYETAISVWATRPIAKDSIFWVTFQPDRDKPLVVEGEEGVIKASIGRWVPLEAPDREFLEFTCGRVYGNFDWTQHAQTDNNPGINNVWPIGDVIKDNDRIVEGGNFANMAFGLPAGEEQAGGSPRYFGRTTDTSGDIWKLFKFNKLKSVSFTDGGNNTGARNIEQNNVYGIQFKQRGLYVCNIHFTVIHNYVCLGGDVTNFSNWPRVAMCTAGSLTVADRRSLIELYSSTSTSSFHLMSNQGKYLRQIHFIAHRIPQSHHLLTSQPATDISNSIPTDQSRVNIKFHFYITEEEVGSVLVHQLNLISLFQATGYYFQDYPDYKFNANPYIHNTNGHKAKSLMEYVDVELEDVGSVIPVQNGTDVQDNPGPGGAGDGLLDPGLN